MHPRARAWVAAHADRTYADALEVGARNINGGIRDLIDTDNYYGIDLAAGDGVDEVADVRTFASEPFDLVVCCEVLEHDPDPYDLVQHCWRLTRGRLIVTAAGPGRAPHSAHDGGGLRDGEHYANIDETLFSTLDVTPTATFVGDGDIAAVWDR